MSFNERITELSELEAKATPGEWWIEEHDGELYADPPNPSVDLVSGPDADFVGGLDSDNDQMLVCALRNKALPLLREMQAENERLRQGIKDVAEKYAEMYDLRDHFYYEMENAQTALLFANRENERLRAGIGKAVEYLQHQFGYDDVLALEQEFRQISFGDVTEFMDFMKELGALQNDA